MTSRTDCEAVLNAGLVRSLLHYDPETGKLTWRRRDRALFGSEGSFKAWNARYAGQEAFTAINSEGYRVGAILRQPSKAHRLAWLIMTGRWPAFVDHVDGNGANNTWSNLREVPQALNCKNAKRYGHNTSGVNGVSWSGRDRGWVARVTVNQKLIYLGCFPTKDEAAQARRRADKTYGFTERHGAPPSGQEPVAA